MPYYANRIGISDQDVPFDLELEAVEQSVAPPYRGGALVTFAARRHQALTGTLAVAVGSQTIVPAMGEMTVAGDGRSWSSPIGSGGEFYLENLPPGDHQAVVAFAGGRCLASLHVPTSSLSLIRLGIVPCSVPGTGPQEHRP